jgi:hypothetical protein
MKRRGAVLLFAMVAAVALSLAPAGATGKRGGDVLVVDDDARHHRSCFGKKRDTFSTIQAAVDEADPGDTIKVCPGLYEENVLVAKRLTILGANAGRDATQGGRGRESIVTGDPEADPAPAAAVRLDADGIVWDGFKIRDYTAGAGIATSPDHAGYVIRDTILKDNGIGVHLGSNGTRPTLICRNRFIANNEFEDAGAGAGIYSDAGAQKVLITLNRFERHNLSAILFADRAPDDTDLQQDIRVEQNKSVDDLSFATFYATANLRLTRNHVRARVGDPDFPGPASAFFIGARNDNVVVDKNRVKAASGNGIDVSDSPEPKRVPPLSAAAPTDVSVLRNQVSGATLAGLHLAVEARNVVVRGNTALDNTLFDCQDESDNVGTPAVKNHWRENLGRTSDPAGLCERPTDLDERDHHGKGKGKDDDKKHKKKKSKKQQHKKKHRPDPCPCGLPWRY